MLKSTFSCNISLIELNYGCSLDHKNEKLNLILVIIYLIIASLIIFTNLALLIIYLKRKPYSYWTFATHYFILILIYNIIGALSTYLVAYSTCVNINKIYFFCLVKYCLLYFIALMLNHITLCLSVEILISLKWISKYRKLINKLNSYLFNVFFTILVILFSFSPLIFNWNHFKKDCDCGHNNVLPKSYILIANFLFFTFSIMTVSVYSYIFIVAKQSKQKVFAQSMVVKTITTTSTTVTASIKNNSHQIMSNTICSDTNNIHINSSSNKNQFFSQNSNLKKINILKVQILIFSLFFVCWCPYMSLVTYETINNIQTYALISRLRNFSASFLMCNSIISPLVYSYRLKFMRTMFCR
jgi:hypothetical protein